MSDFKDFHKVKNMLFDVSKLKKGLEEVLKIKNYDSANGIPNFAAICLNQVPGDPASTKGNNARGVFWTKPDESGFVQKTPLTLFPFVELRSPGI